MSGGASLSALRVRRPQRQIKPQGGKQDRRAANKTMRRDKTTVR